MDDFFDDEFEDELFTDDDEYETTSYGTSDEEYDMYGSPFYMGPCGKPGTGFASARCERRGAQEAVQREAAARQQATDVAALANYVRSQLPRPVLVSHSDTSLIVNVDRNGGACKLLQQHKVRMKIELNWVRRQQHKVGPIETELSWVTWQQHKVGTIETEVGHTAHNGKSLIPTTHKSSGTGLLMHKN
jgi:hypothetical protein